MSTSPTEHAVDFLRALYSDAIEAPEPIEWSLDDEAGRAVMPFTFTEDARPASLIILHSTPHRELVTALSMAANLFRCSRDAYRATGHPKIADDYQRHIDTVTSWGKVLRHD